MRRLLIGTIAMALVAGLGLVPSGVPSAVAIDASSTTESTIVDSSTTDPGTTLESSTSTDPGTTVITTTSTTVPPSTMVPASRGTAVQVAATLPPPTAPPTAPPTTVRPSPYPVPANSGTGRRVVYSKAQMRVWIIEAAGNVSRTYLVSGRYAQPAQGTFYVFSRSSFTCHLGNTSICMRYMVRFTRGPSGDNIGFHEIPRRNGVPMQSDSQLGQALSAGCVRQATADAQYMWAWAGLGTKVVVVW